MKIHFIDVNTISILSQNEVSLIYKVLLENFNYLTQHTSNYVSSDTKNDIISSIQGDNIYDLLENKIIFTAYNQHKEILGIGFYENIDNKIYINGLYSSFHILDHLKIKEPLFNFMLNYINNKEGISNIKSNIFNSEIEDFNKLGFINLKESFNYSFLNNFTFPSTLVEFKK